MESVEFSLDNQNFLYGIGEVVTFPADTVVIAEGARESHFFQVLEGVLEIPSEDFVIRLFPKQFFGELGFLSDVPRTKDVISATSVRLLKIERQEVIAKFETSPEDKEAFMDTLRIQAGNILQNQSIEDTQKFFAQLAAFAKVEE